MKNGNNVYVGPTTAPATDENGLFAFYAVDGVDGAYYIYSTTQKMAWLRKGCKLKNIEGRGVYIINGKKVLVK